MLQQYLLQTNPNLNVHWIPHIIRIISVPVNSALPNALDAKPHKLIFHSISRSDTHHIVNNAQIGITRQLNLNLNSLQLIALKIRELETYCLSCAHQ